MPLSQGITRRNRPDTRTPLTSGPVSYWRKWTLRSLLLLGMVMTCQVQAASIDQAKRMYDRIAGVPPVIETDPVFEDVLSDMRDDIDNGDPLAAALRATNAPEFYSVTLKNFAAPWTNRDRSVLCR